ncbi:hypothetical protein Nos7524_5540 [Nostoc sp. PCC 7524]|nr:hypothetical protein Nos7524_5540 [Nostoc sp. PCC 7524]
MKSKAATSSPTCVFGADGLFPSANFLKNAEINNMKEQSDFLSNLSDFLYPRSCYYGQFKPEYLVFNANLQEFAQRVGYISSLQTNGKISPQEAYDQIKTLWKQLKRAKKELEATSINLQSF